MCNALGHPPDCDCGFGPWHGRAGQASAALLHAPTVGKPLVRPARCWWCQNAVYFYRNEHGGCALFDHLGMPWPIHHCWEEHRFSVQHLRARNHYERDSAIPRLPQPQIEPSARETVADITGFVSHVGETRRRFGDAAGIAEFTPIEVCTKAPRVYRLLVPSAIAAGFAVNDAVEVHGRWIARGKEWLLFVRKLRSHPRSGGAGPMLAGFVPSVPGPCGVCRSQVAPAHAWGIGPGPVLDCAQCADARAQMSPQAFARRAPREVQPKLSLPPGLVGIYAGRDERGRRIRVEMDDNRRWKGGSRGGAYTVADGNVALFAGKKLAFTFKFVGNEAAARLVPVQGGPSSASRLSTLTRVDGDRMAAGGREAAVRLVHDEAEQARRVRRLHRRFGARVERLDLWLRAVRHLEAAQQSRVAAMAKARTPRDWERLQAKQAKGRAELEYECRQLKSACMRFRELAQKFGLFAAQPRPSILTHFLRVENAVTAHPAPAPALPHPPKQLATAPEHHRRPQR